MVGLHNTEARWGAVSMAFHWTIAFLVFGMWGLGYAMTHIVDDLLSKFELYQWHKSFGFTLFVLMLGRILWRISQKRSPSLPSGLGRIERRLAQLTHKGLYLILLLMPLAGWVSTETSELDFPTVIFGLFALPDPFGPDKALHELFRETHEILAFTLAFLLILHIGAAFKHHVIMKDDVLRRMLPAISR